MPSFILFSITVIVLLILVFLRLLFCLLHYKGDISEIITANWSDFLLNAVVGAECLSCLISVLFKHLVLSLDLVDVILLNRLHLILFVLGFAPAVRK